MLDIRHNKRKDLECCGIMHCRFVEPALAYFFGEVDPTKKEVPVEFLVHNTWRYHVPNVDQYITLTKVNGIDLQYKVPYTSQTGDTDLWESVDKGGLSINIVIGVDSFYITDIAKKQ